MNPNWYFDAGIIQPMNEAEKAAVFERYLEAYNNPSPNCYLFTKNRLVSNLINDSSPFPIYDEDLLLYE